MDHDRMNNALVVALTSAAALAGVLAGAASAQDAVSDPAIARSSADTSLEWGPCPAFMPAGCALAVLHGDPSKPHADVFFKVPARSSLPVHWHTSAERMVLVAGELRVEFEGQEPTVLTPGTYAYGPPARPHGGACISATPCILFIAFEAPVDAVAGRGP